MDKKMFRSIVLLLGIAAGLTFALFRIETVLHVIGVLVSVLMPVFVGIIIALILDRPFKWFQKKYLTLFKKSNRKHGLSIGLAVASTYIAVFAFIILFLIIVAPKILCSVGELISNTEVYTEKVEQAVNDFIANSESLNGKIKPLDLSGLDDWLGHTFAKITELAEKRLPEVIQFASQFIEGIVTAVLGTILSVYILLNRHRMKWQAKKAVYALLPRNAADFIRDTAKLSAGTFSNYISGRILDSVIVGILCFIGMAIFRFEYAALISFMVGVTNFIPMIGPALGIIPSAIILLLVSPVQCFWFLVFICILMFLDSNLIDLRISGEATGLPPLFVLIAVIAGGSLFGFVGFILTVPSCAVLYTLAKRAVVSICTKKNIPLSDEPYVDPPKKKRLKFPDITSEEEKK